MREHRALRPAGRTRRVTDERGVVLGQPRLLGARRRLADPLLVGAADVERQRDAEVARARAVDQRSGARVAQDESDLVGGEAEVDRDRDRSEQVRRQQRLGELEAVVEKQRDAVAAADALGLEDHCEPGRAVVQAGVCPTVLAEHQRGAIGMRAAAAPDQLGQHQPAGAVERLGHRFRVPK